MGERNPTKAMAVAVDILIGQVDQLQQAVDVLAGQRSPTGQRDSTDALIDNSEHTALNQQIGQLKDTIMNLPGVR